MNERTSELLTHLASRPGHDEVKADFRQLLVEEFGAELRSLEFERRVPEVRGRLDALIGRTVFEAKSDLTREWADVERRMPDYLADREREENDKFVGIASDGLRWVLFELAAGKLVKVKETTLDPEKADIFLAWLDGAVALRSQLAPTPLTIRMELGQDSVAYRRASATLAVIWDALKDEPAVALKRQLWSQLLKLVHGREIESDALWIQHTFLVVVAKAIALAVLGLKEDSPARLLSGSAFEEAGISGAVEGDFFDWVVSSAQGEEVVRRIVAHVRRFRLDAVESDVLKILYESLIDRDERHGLGEYYTPDWLAAKVVREAVNAPLEQRVLDPACGSGTFLFHAIRGFLREAEDAGMTPADRARQASEHVAGMDIHPVAVIIARVTYLLALAPALTSRAGGLSIPVYLGDAMQLSVTQLIGATELEVRVPPGPAGEAATTLTFPEVFCRDPPLFDRAIEALRAGSEQHVTRRQIEAQLTQIVRERHKRDASEEEERGIADLGATYVVFDDLRRAGRDSVWTYVARNLSRPLFLAGGGGWAHVIVGNPPWVAYRHMSADLQRRFKELARGERVYVGGKLTTQNDLAALFTVRVAGLYLRAAGRIAFVLPFAALTRGQYERLRSGSFLSARLFYDAVWTIHEVEVAPPHTVFPVPACVIFARRRAVSGPFPKTVRSYRGSLPLRDASEDVADRHLSFADGIPRPTEATFEGGSAYRRAFRQGATLVPRMLCLIERRTAGRLGANPDAPLVCSRRSAQEKRPWRDAAGIEAPVEREFIQSVLLGESIVPFRVFRPFEAVLPVDESGKLLDAEAAGNRGVAGLRRWMAAAEAVWELHRPSPITFVEQLDYYGKLRSQFPLSALRVVYAKAGTLPAATLVRDPKSVVDHMLYWSAVSTELEGHFLCAILNSEAARSRTAGFQSRGQWGARHFDKVVFSLPIPPFDPADELHAELARGGERAAGIAASVDLPLDMRFQRARATVRERLSSTGVAAAIDRLVLRLLGP